MIDQISMSETPLDAANVVMGGVKSRMQDETRSLDISIPTVISGRNLKSTMGDCTSRVVKRVNVDAFAGELSFLARSNP